MFALDKSYIDKSLPVPVGTQLRGLIAYMISQHDMVNGTRLPSVREMAEALGVAPKTVSQVYQQLREAGLIGIRRGAGAFVARDPDRALRRIAGTGLLRRRIDELFDEAAAAGIGPEHLLSMVNAQIQVRRRIGLNLVFVGNFAAPARDYAQELQAFCGSEDRIEVTTIDDLAASADERQKCANADVVLTFVHRAAEVQGSCRVPKCSASASFLPRRPASRSRRSIRATVSPP